MNSDIFGTDGIRGRSNKYPMIPSMVMKLGMAASIYFKKNLKTKTNRVIIAKDPRISGYMFETAISAGLLSMGMEVYLLGPMPTPGLAFLSRNMIADFGVMISASHNPYYDNGIKLFDTNGRKIFKKDEEAIKKLLTKDLESNLISFDKIGKAKRLDGSDGRYVQHVKSIFPPSLTLSDLKIAVDCANGATYKVAIDVLSELGSRNIFAVGVSPDGFNINKDCGSTNSSSIVKALLESGSNVGIAFDGDGDRLLMVDEKGDILDGDIILGIIASYWHEKGTLLGKSVVGTIASNWGLEKFLNSKGLNLIRTNVGDKYILEYMSKNNLNLGGESSGHIILSDYNTTSDGLLACLEVLKIMLLKEVPLSDLRKQITRVPRVFCNIDITNKSILSLKKIESSIKDIQSTNKSKVRIIFRKSGTEEVIRLITEGDDEELIGSISRDLEYIINKQLIDNFEKLL